MDNNICKNCGKAFTGNYCNWCGQKKYSEADKNLTHIAEEVFHFLTHFEGSFIRTAVTVLRYPGKLSADYCDGIRKRYYQPISFFLLLVVIYLLFPLLDGLNMKMEYYKSLSLFGDSITSQIDAKVAASGISESELSELFHHKSEKISKILLFILIPLTTVPLSILNRKKQVKVYDHFIAATEINIFIVMVLFLIAPVFIVLALKLFSISDITEETIKPIYYVISIVWLTPFFIRHGAGFVSSLLKAHALLGIYWVIVMIIYKAILFQLTFALL